MALSYVSSASYTNGGTSSSSAVMNIPSGIAANDLLVLHIVISLDTAVITTPTGWTLIRTDSDATVARKAALYYRVATGSEGSTVTVSLDSSRRIAGGIVALRGANTTTPIDVHGGQTTTTASTSCTAPSVTASAAANWLLTFTATQSDCSVTPAAGATERWDIGNAAGSGDCVSSCDTEPLSASGATGTRVTTLSVARRSFGQNVVVNADVTPPAPPTALTATTRIGGTQVDLAWTDNATNETAYTVERSLDGSTGWAVLTSSLAANATRYTDTGLTAGTAYYYRVKATNSQSASAYSNVAVTWNWTERDGQIIQRVGRATIAASAGSGYMALSKDGTAWSYYSGPLAADGVTLTAVDSQSAAETAALALPTNGNWGVPGMVEARYARLYHRNATSYTLYEFYPRRLVESDDVRAEAIQAVHIKAGTITGDRIAALAITGDKIQANAIDGKLITGATIQTAASGERIVMNASNLTSYNSSGVAQVTLAGGNGGSLTAGATRLDVNGLNFTALAAWTTGLRWINATGGVIGTMAAYDSNQGRGVQETIDLPDGISGSRMWSITSGINTSAIQLNQHATDPNYRFLTLSVGDTSGGRVSLAREYCVISAQNYISLTAPTITVDGTIAFGSSTGNGDANLKPRGNGNSAVVFLHGGIANQWNSTNYVGGGAMVRLASNASSLSGNLALFAGGTSGSIELLTRDTTRVQVSAPGEVGIGTTATTNRRLQVQGFGTGSTYALVVMNGSGGNLMYVRDDSFLWAATNWVIGSDARSKAHIRDLPDSTALLKQLKPKQYARATNPNRTEYGVLAQDLQAVAPDLVLNAATPDGKELLAVDYTSLFMLGLNALMKLTARVESLETKAGT